MITWNSLNWSIIAQEGCIAELCILRHLDHSCRPLTPAYPSSNKGSKGEHCNHTKQRKGPCRHHARLLLRRCCLLCKSRLFRIVLASYSLHLYHCSCARIHWCGFRTTSCLIAFTIWANCTVRDLGEAPRASSSNPLGKPVSLEVACASGCWCSCHRSDDSHTARCRVALTHLANSAPCVLGIAIGANVAAAGECWRGCDCGAWWHLDRAACCLITCTCCTNSPLFFLVPSMGASEAFASGRWCSCHRCDDCRTARCRVTHTHLTNCGPCNRGVAIRAGVAAAG